MANEEAVLRVARAYGRMKLLGVYVEDGHAVSVCTERDQERLTEHYKGLLLWEAEKLVQVLGCLGEKNEIAP
jgi:hypothetical protein